MLFEYPSKEDWNRISQSFPFEKLNLNIDEIILEGDPIDIFGKRFEVDTWINHLQYRIYDVWKSYVLLTFYFEMGIPDDPYYISPGKKGESIQYYPNFEEKHFNIKSQFDYYVDIFYYKIFSAWDTLGHLLNVWYNLRINIQNISFKKAVKKLKAINESLSNKLNEILIDPGYEKAKSFRNDITHNYLPNSLGPSVTRPSEHKVALGIGKYINSEEFYQNIRCLLFLFVKTLKEIKQNTLN